MQVANDPVVIFSMGISGDGNTLALGAYLEDSDFEGVHGAQDNNDANNSGAVYVFTRSAGTWSQQAYVKASNTGRFDRFGYSVSLNGDGNTLAVGAIREDSNATGVSGAQDNDDRTADDSGAVYLY